MAGRLPNVSAWPQGRAPDGSEEVGLGPALVSDPAPVPTGRGRWRLHLQARQFGPATRSAPIAELTSARSRRLETKYNAPAQLTFTLSGRSPEAAALAELRSDIVATRWDEASGTDVIVFRGIVAQTEDQISEQQHTVTVTCHSYLKMLERRILTGPAGLTFTQWDQDDIVANLLYWASAMTTSGGQSFGAGSYLPMREQSVNPDGSPRSVPSGQLRDRNYLGNQKLDEALWNLAAVLNGFDVDLVPYGLGDADAVRVFYPYQGVQRFDMALVYGSTVSALTRTVNAGDFASYWRVLGKGDESAQMFAEAWNADAVDIDGPGLWQSGDNASDVSIQSTLDDKAHGDLATSSVLTPSYTVTMRPGAYSWGNPNMGDVVPLVVRSGRIDVTPETGGWVRVVGLAFAISDDGDEAVEVTVGRPTRTLTDLITAPVADVNALARR